MFSQCLSFLYCLESHVCLRSSRLSFLPWNWPFPFAFPVFLSRSQTRTNNTWRYIKTHPENHGETSCNRMRACTTMCNSLQRLNRLDLWPWPALGGPCCRAFLNHPGHKSSMDLRNPLDFSESFTSLYYEPSWVKFEINLKVWIWPREPNLLKLSSPYAYPMPIHSPCFFDTLQVKS